MSKLGLTLKVHVYDNNPGQEGVATKGVKYEDSKEIKEGR